MARNDFKNLSGSTHPNWPKVIEVLKLLVECAETLAKSQEGIDKLREEFGIKPINGKDSKPNIQLSEDGL
jgi:hypothetical protein